MYDKILVPLDGSKLAECVLPYVETLAKGCDTKKVILVTVTEELRGLTAAPELRTAGSGSGGGGVVTLGKMTEQGARYLNRIAKRLENKGLNVQAEVLMGKPAEAIVSYINSSNADIVIMSSHGRNGPSRWAFGSTADRVFRSSCIPVMVVRAPGCSVPGA
ncbi:MAG: universal stress protein [Chloroflexota bacterium]